MIGPLIAGLPRAEIEEYSAGLSTFAGTRLVTLEDGVERGQRVVEMRTAGGLYLEVLVDRCGDIGLLSLNGVTMSWHSPGGLASPGLVDHEADRGQGFLRGFGGFLNTCGLDHIRQPENDRAEHAAQETLSEVFYPLHGKGSIHPARLVGHGLVEHVSKPFIYCETEFVQALPLVYALRLRRRIEIPLVGQSVKMHDVVRNVGSTPATHMLLYHINIGFPMVAVGTAPDFGQDSCIWRSEEHNPLASFAAPRARAQNAISVFRHGSEEARVALDNPETGLSMTLVYPSGQLPYCQFLRMIAPGIYGVGIEPCTTWARSRTEARQQGEMIVLRPGEERSYDISLAFGRSNSGHR